MIGHVIVLCVYIPLSADVACDKIHTVTARLQTQRLEALILNFWGL